MVLNAVSGKAIQAYRILELLVESSTNLWVKRDHIFPSQGDNSFVR
jgi:hypothetical protein